MEIWRDGQSQTKLFHIPIVCLGPAYLISNIISSVQGAFASCSIMAVIQTRVPATGKRNVPIS